jgi:outer membrane putative beta-barrel porin/alpha-amylase
MVCVDRDGDVMFRSPGLFLLIVLFLGTGCAHCREVSCDGDAAGSKTLFEWKPGSDNSPSPKENGGANGGNGQAKEAEEPDTIQTDRPDFTEASTTVGKGRIQLESGYTFTRDRSGGVTASNHSYPEALLRIGMFADWFELRVGQNFATNRSEVGAFTDSLSGAEDLYLGVKLGLTEQQKILPEMALILQTTVPSGHSDLTAKKMQPGFNWLYGWDVISDRLTLGASTQANKSFDALNHGYVELAQSVTVGYGLTDRLRAYTEWFAFFPCGAIAPGVAAQHYFDGGFTYLVTPNFQLDIRGGVGLSRQADDFFVGSGFAVRY